MVQKITVEPNHMQWGHYAAIVILSALAAAYRPHYLLYVGALRWAWCALSGRPGRGFGAVLIFFLAYLGVSLTGFLEGGAERQPEAAQCEPATGGSSAP